MSFSILSDIYAPEKIKFTHSLIEKLRKLDDVNVDDKLRNTLFDVITELASKEDKLRITRDKYEKRESRFVSTTFHNLTKLDQVYTQNNWVLKDVPQKKILKNIENQDWQLLIQNIEECLEIIEIDVKVCRNRVDYMDKIFDDISKDMLERIRNFEFKGLKKASNGLRIKMMPILVEYKSNLKKGLVDGLISRVEMHETINTFLSQIKEDIYGELSENQELMLDNLNPNITVEELIDYLEAEEIRNDFIYLLKTGKINIHFSKIIDDLI